MVDSPSHAAKVVTMIAVIALVAAFMTPIAINQLEDDTSTTITTAVGNTSEVNAELNSTLDSVDGTNDQATYTLQTDSQSTQKTIANGTTETFSFDRGDVNVTVNDVDSTNNEATATYDHNKDFAFSDGARSLWGLLGLVIVLGVFLLVVGRALDFV